MTVAMVAMVTGPAPRARAADDFTYGTGLAQAGIVTPALNAGQLSVNVVLGDATAGFQDQTGRATSRTVAVPLLQAAGGSTVCGQKGASLTGSLPAPITADTSTTGNTAPVDHVQPADRQGPTVQEAHAAPGAQGNSSTGYAAYGLPGIVDIGGGEATASVTADPVAQTRLAVATSSISDVSILGGLVHLSGMRWHLEHHADGADSRNDRRSFSGTFSLDGIKIDPGAVAGLPAIPGLTQINIPIPSADDTESAVAQANSILAPLGVIIRLPSITGEDTAGRHQVTPLQIAFGGPNWVLAPVFGQLLNNPSFGQFQTALLKSLFDPASCNELNGLLKGLPQLNQPYNTLGSFAPIVLAVATGVVSGGEVNLGVGGVGTALDDTYYPPLQFAGPAFVSPTAAGSTATSGHVSSSSPSVHHVAVAPGAQGTTTVDGTTVATDARCETTSPAGMPACWLGRAPLGAALAVSVAVASLVVDEITRRRRVTRLPESETAG